MIRARSGLLLALVWGGLGACGTPLTDDTVDLPDEIAPDPGRVPMRRLTRAEYDNVIRDLVRMDLAPARDFPVDDATDGFDTTASGLAVSPLHVELYEQAAARVAAQIVDRPVLEPIEDAYEAEDERFSLDEGAGRVLGDTVLIWSNGALTGRVSVPVDGTYQLAARVWAAQAGDEYAKVRLGLVGGTGDFFDVEEEDLFGAAWIRVDVPMREGLNTFELRFVNDYYDADTGGDRNVYVDAFRVEGPTPFVAETNPAWDAVVSCDPDGSADEIGCVRSIVADFARRAWRRPVSDDEVDQLTAIADLVVKNGDPALWGLEFALRAVLASPDFVFLAEPELPEDATEVQPVDAHTLAQRLSFFLWGSIPDDELWSLADSGALLEDEVLEAQIRRMVYDDPKASWLAEEFAGQWLGIRMVDDAFPDFWNYPIFREEMRASMKEAMERRFMDIVRNNPPITELVTGREAWVDGWIAPIYGARSIGAESGFVKIDASSYGRHGWLTEPGLLMGTSYPTRTSPVRRGVWVLSNLLCDEPPPPPPGVEGFPEPSDDAATIRERLAAHRTSPSCAGCHETMDNIGLAFEHFDGVGGWRDYDAGQPVDASGVLEEVEFYGIDGLAPIIAADPRLTRCAVEKTFTFAHRRPPTEADQPYLDDIHEAFEAGSLQFVKLVTAIVRSPTFQAIGPTRPDPEDTGDAATDDAADEGGDE